MRQDEAARIVEHWLSRFDGAMRVGAIEAMGEVFLDTCLWRDLLSFSWNVVTTEGLQAVTRMLSATWARTAPHGWCHDGAAMSADGVTEGWFSFETASGRGLGHVRLREGRAFTLFTTLRELNGFEERKGENRARGVEHGAIRNRKSWADLRAHEQAELGVTTQPYCLIVGGSQGGLALAARLRRLDVPTLIIDRLERPGDAWRGRYKQLCLHDPVWADHMPYIPFPDDWPVYTPKDKLADWLEMYCKVLELNFWGGATCTTARHDAARGAWEVQVERDGQTITLRPRHLVLATGLSGIPNMPAIPGAEEFRGVLQHSSDYGSGEDFAGRRCVVIGSNNSAHDVCADLWEHGADVTMVQRSSTLVARADTLRQLTSGRLFSEAALSRGITTDKADLMFASVPYRMLPDIQRPIWQEIRRRDADLYDALREVGFDLDFGEGDSGLYMKYVRRGSGYYIDVGASSLIARREVKLAKGQVVRLLPHAAVLEDGTELPADLIVCATGFGPMSGWAAQIVSRETAEKIGPSWGLGSGTTHDPGPWEGELRNMWRPTAQEGLWFHGGNLQQSRFYSLSLALQIKARMEGLATPVFRLADAIGETA